MSTSASANVVRGVSTWHGSAMTYQFFRPVPARYGLEACQHRIPVHEAANASAPSPHGRPRLRRRDQRDQQGRPLRLRGQGHEGGAVGPSQRQEDAQRRSGFTTAYQRAMPDFVAQLRFDLAGRAVRYLSDRGVVYTEDVAMVSDRPWAQLELVHEQWLPAPLAVAERQLIQRPQESSALGRRQGTAVPAGIGAAHDQHGQEALAVFLDSHVFRQMPALHGFASK
ncbi:hypothetical protein ACIHFD_58735 [Nonomuraea sp. NPDC051941]|uniref:hypothetical protein n=1 Tax=Nonomuraea sp. NPDC051941 TaxID=3364373 RepID=UPI0037C9AC7D